ncbi:hypothetical protein J6590_082538 [Homalodisca vitripennis]|nr:hypothetical protein J6590_082538 [Homalodisca vitripennis]
MDPSRSEEPRMFVPHNEVAGVWTSGVWSARAGSRGQLWEDGEKPNRGHTPGTSQELDHCLTEIVRLVLRREVMDVNYWAFAGSIPMFPGYKFLPTPNVWWIRHSHSSQEGTNKRNV